MKRLHIAIIYNASACEEPESPNDQGGTAHLRQMVRRIGRVLRRLGYRVTIMPLAEDLLAFQRRLRRLKPDVVFNQYDDVAHGTLYEMSVAALVSMLGYAMTGSSALALGLSRDKHVCAKLLHGAGVPIPPGNEVIERIGDIERRRWTFPLIVQPSQEDAGIGLDRGSVVHTKKALKERVRLLLKSYRQPVRIQRFLPGREFNIGIIGGRKLRVLPLAEVNYADLPPEIPPIMSYAAKWMENTLEYQKTAVICPAPVTAELARQISRTALQAFRAVGAWGYGRVDARLDGNGVLRVLEVNCNASLEEDTALARSAKVAGITYPQLLQLIVKAALEKPPVETVLPMR